MPTTMNAAYLPPPVREAATVADVWDTERRTRVLERWRSQDGVLLARDRQIEENVRMLAGQQWGVWDPLTGQWIDIAQWWGDDAAWRQRPTINYLLPWYVLTHARLTENAPILTFVPGPDRKDSELAEVLDTLYKATWRAANMIDVHDRLMMWLIPAGRAYLTSRIDLTKGPWHPWVGQAQVPLVHPMEGAITQPDGSPVLVDATGVPFNRDGQPQAVMNAATRQLTPIPNAQPHQERQGQIIVDVDAPMAVRGEWGPEPWHEKLWHARRHYLTPEQCYERWGVEVQPDTAPGGVQQGALDRLLYGAGFYGPLSDAGGMNSSSGAWQAKGLGLVEVTETWEKPCDPRYLDDPQRALLAQTPDQPGGRYTVVTRTTVITDGPRPVAFPYTSPIEAFDFARLPGRQTGTSLQDPLNGPQRAYNKLRAQAADHANLCSNPKFVVDQLSGIDDGDWDNEPGTGVKAVMRQGVDPIKWITPPSLGNDVYRVLELARNEIQDLGNTKGTDGAPPTRDASGDLIQELRFNTDRHVGPTLRRAVESYCRVAETWKVLLAVIYDEARAVHDAGDDNIARTVMVYPELFSEGVVDVVPDLESMQPEGRGERQSKVWAMWQQGAFGDPKSSQAIAIYLEQARFPNLSRAARPGGVDRTTAEQENGALLKGEPVPVLPFYDHVVHLENHLKVMKTRDYTKYPPAIQQAFMAHCQQHQQALMAQQSPTPMPGPSGPPHGGGGAPSHAPPDGDGDESPPMAPGPPKAPDGHLAPTALPEPTA